MRRVTVWQSVFIPVTFPAASDCRLVLSRSAFLYPKLLRFAV